MNPPSSNAGKSSARVFKHAAVATDSKIASDIGNDILTSRSGNAVDAAVAALFATGVMSAHSCGIGGGSFYVIYDRNQGWFTADSRETAPLASTEDMYSRAGSSKKSLIGGMAIGVPGEVKGLYEVHAMFGRVPWKDVVMPTVYLCQNGVPLTEAVHKALRNFSDKRKAQFSEYFDDNRNLKPVGTPIKLITLSRTLLSIAEEPLSFYNGSLAEKIVADISDAGGIITLNDMKNYTVKWSVPVVLNLPGGLSIYSVPPPGSGPVLSFILNILSGYNFSPASVASEENYALTMHRIIEAMKFAFAKRTVLGDDNFVDVSKDVKEMQSLAYGEATRKKINDTCTQPTAYYNPVFQMSTDQGTAHISVIDGQGNAVSVTSTINIFFGCHVKGSRTGVIFNNEMDDFSVPNSSNYYHLPASTPNFIRPGKRPMSSMCPAVVFDNKKGKVKLVTGATGGSAITTVVAMNIMDVIWFGTPLPASVDHPRIHHQLFPPELQLESNFPEAIQRRLQEKRHVIERIHCRTVIQAIEVRENDIIAVSDFRKGGEPSGY